MHCEHVSGAVRRENILVLVVYRVRGPGAFPLPLPPSRNVLKSEGPWDAISSIFARIYPGKKILVIEI